MTEQQYREKLEAIAELKSRGEDVSQYKSKISEWEKSIEKKPSMLESALRGAHKGATLGLAPHAVSIGRYLAGKTGTQEYQKPYKEILEETKKQYGEAEKAHPVTSFLGNIAGGLAYSPTKLAGLPLKTALLRGGTETGAMGALSGMGYGEGKTISEKAKEAALGGITGAAIGVGGQLAGKALGKIPAIQKLRSKLINVEVKKNRIDPRQAEDVIRKQAVNLIDEYNVHPTARHLGRIAEVEREKLSQIVSQSPETININELRTKIIDNIKKSKKISSVYKNAIDEGKMIIEINDMFDDLTDNPVMQNLSDWKFELQNKIKQYSKPGMYGQISPSSLESKKNIILESSRAIDDYFVNKMPTTKEPLNRLSILHDIVPATYKEEKKGMLRIPMIGRVPGQAGVKTITNKVLKTIEQKPGKLGKFYQVLSRALKQGQSEFAMAHSLLYRQSDEYKGIIDNLENIEDIEDEPQPKTEITKLNAQSF